MQKPLTARSPHRIAADMLHRAVRLLALALAVGGTAAHAGGPGPEERLLVLGRCDGDAACSWACDEATNPVCGDAGGTCALPAPVFAARMRITVDDQACSGAAGGRLTLAVAGRRADGTDFTLPDTVMDFCDVQQSEIECGGTLGLCELSVPRQTVFLCATFLFNAVLDENAIPDATWLPYSIFPPTIADALRAAFPGTSGEPVVATATELPFTDGIGVVQPSAREFCITGAFAAPTAPLPTPAGLASVVTTTATSSLAFGDCPTLPLVTSTTTTTLPSDPCAGQSGDGAVRCAVDQGASACSDGTPPPVIGNLRDKAATQVAKALAAVKPRQRTKRLGAARRALTMARRKALHRRGLAQECRDGLTRGIDAAIAVVDALRAI